MFGLTLHSVKLFLLLYFGLDIINASLSGVTRVGEAVRLKDGMFEGRQI